MSNIIKVLVIFGAALLVPVFLVLIGLRAPRLIRDDSGKLRYSRGKVFLYLFCQIAGVMEALFVVIELFDPPFDLERFARSTLIAVGVGVLATVGMFSQDAGEIALRSGFLRLVARAPKNLLRRLRLDERLKFPRK